MKNTTKHVGVVAAVLTAAGITGACPGTAFADSSAAQVPANGSAPGTLTHRSGPDRDGDDNWPIVVHGPVLNHAPILDGGPILGRGPGHRIDNDGWGRRIDNDGWGRHFDNDGQGRHFDNDRRIVVRGPVRRVDEPRTWVSQSQTGTICSVSDGNIVVTGANGATWTWTTDTTTTVRIVGVRGALGGLRAGDRILVTGLLNGTSRHANSVVAVSRAETIATPRHAEMFVAVSRPEMFVTDRHAQIHRRDERTDRCEHSAGRHKRGENCGHPAHSRGRDRGGRHRL